MAKDSLSKQISIAFLERVRADFKKRYGGGKASTAIAKSLNKEFGYFNFKFDAIVNTSERFYPLTKW